MLMHPQHIMFYSSDKLAALGLQGVLEACASDYSAYQQWSFSEAIAECGKHYPRLFICIFHENMLLTGTLNAFFTLQQRYPSMHVLLLTRRLVPLFNGVGQYLPQFSVMDLKSPHKAIINRIKACLGAPKSARAASTVDIMLSDRALQALLMQAWGCSIEHIARHMAVSTKTINACKMQALAALHIKTRHEMVDLLMLIDELRMIVSWLRMRPEAKSRLSDATIAAV